MDSGLDSLSFERAIARAPELVLPIFPLLLHAFTIPPSFHCTPFRSSHVTVILSDSVPNLDTCVYLEAVDVEHDMDTRRCTFHGTR